MAEIICPNCKTSFRTGTNGSLVTTNQDGTYALVSETIRNENKENTMDLTTINFKEMTDAQKSEILKAMGFNPFDFATQTVDTNDPLVQEIFANGYVKNEKLHRRWITAQTMRLLGWTDGVMPNHWGKTKDNWTENVKKMYDWQYAWRQVGKELDVIDKLQRVGETTPRSVFFSDEKISAMLDEYIETVRDYCYNLPKHNCKGVPYIKLNGRNFFVSDIEKKVITPIKKAKRIMENTFLRMYDHHTILRFIKSDAYVKLPRGTKLSPTWVDMFKSAGAYYTMENLVKYSGLKLVKDHELLDRDTSLQYLQSRVNDKGFQLLGLLKQSLVKNNFVFSEVI